MNREIKFRIWHKKGKEWCGILYPNETISPHSLEYEEEDLVFCQFTGLKDSLGKEIFEGYIIKDTWKENHPYGYRPDEWYDMDKIFEVKYSGCSFNLERERSEAQICVENFHREIIGNIFENPELLKKL